MMKTDIKFKLAVFTVAAVVGSFVLIASNMSDHMKEMENHLTSLFSNLNVFQFDESPTTTQVPRPFNRFFPPPSFHPSEYWNKSRDVKDLTEEEMLRYMHWSDRNSCYLSYDFGGKHLTLNGQTGIDGQKTVCMDKGVAPVPNKCFVFSIGINNEWSFDEQMEKFGCQVFAFDPSMGKEDHNHSASIHFFNVGLGGKDTDNGTRGWKIRTFSSLYEMMKNYHGGAIIDILKVDIDGNEWEALPLIIESGMLDKIKQIDMEVHYNPGTLRDNLKVLKQLEDKGMVRFALRYNRFVPAVISGKNDAYLYELAWFNSKFKDPQPLR